MKIELRPEGMEDHRETETVIREAFWNRYVPGCSEHYLMNVMRACPAFLPELDYVAADGEKIVGGIAYVKSTIIGDDGRRHEVLCLGPISVLPEYQGRGIAGKMIERTAAIARELGFCAIVLCGDPDCYSHCGFSPAENYAVRTADDLYAAALQARELYPHALSGKSGRFVADQIYEVDEAAAAIYDQQFPRREKVRGTPSQKRFEALLTMCRPADR